MLFINRYKKKTTRVASIHSVVGTNVTCWKVARSRERINYNQGLVSIETIEIELTPTHYQYRPTASGC